MKKEKYLLILLIIAFITINYSYLDSLLEKNFGEQRELGLVERIIDGDTIVINGTSVRLLGINTPEKGELYSLKAKEFLEAEIFNKTVELKFGKEKYDKYKRILAYVFYEGRNINLEIVNRGYANFYFPSGKDNYYEEFVQAWENCLVREEFLCEKSKETCIELKELDYKNEIIVLNNKCSSSVNLDKWEIKDEGRKKYIFDKFVLDGGGEVSIITGDEENTEGKLFWSGQDYIWTDSGDSLFLRDSEGKLVLYYHY